MRKKEKDRLKQLEGMGARIKRLEHRVKVLECAHTNVAFVFRTHAQPLIWDGGTLSHSKCVDCGKILETYFTDADFLRAQLEYEEGKCSEKVDSLRERLAALEAE